MKIIINSKNYEANEDETVLEVCRRENIPIPTLCAHDDLKREATCRLCLVEIGGRLVPSCVAKAVDKMEVITESERIKKAREINMELLWTDHAGKCATCKKNRRCELQKLAEDHKIENFHFVPRKGEMTTGEELELLKDNWSRVVVDQNNPVIARTTELCVECKRCINICPTQELGFNHRSGDTVVGTPYEKPLDCIFCGQCAKHCPTGAIVDQNDLNSIITDLDDINKLAVAIVDPQVLKSIKFEFKNVDSFEKLAYLLRSIGFERIFDMSWGIEEYKDRLDRELESRLRGGRAQRTTEKLLINSDCPALTRYIYKKYPEFISGEGRSCVSTVEIPDELMAEVVKNKYAQDKKIDPKSIVVISISSCTAKKMKKYKYLDQILTVRELGRLARKKNIEDGKISESRPDNFVVRQNMRKNRKIRAISAMDFQSVEKILDGIYKKKVDCDYFEGYVCKGGCANGGGQAIRI